MLVSCGSEPVAQPFLAKPLKAGKEVEKKVGKEREEKQKLVKKEKLLAGQLSFHGLSEAELANFRVIPERGKKLLRAENKTFEQVDGFWWKGSGPAEWFKIPGTSSAWVGKGEVPKKYTAKVERAGLTVHTRSNGLVKLVGALRKGVKRPGWVKNVGETKCPAAWPWAALVE